MLNLVLKSFVIQTFKIYSKDSKNPSNYKKICSFLLHSFDIIVWINLESYYQVADYLWCVKSRDIIVSLALKKYRFSLFYIADLFLGKRSIYNPLGKIYVIWLKQKVKKFAQFSFELLFLFFKYVFFTSKPLWKIYFLCQLSYSLFIFYFLSVWNKKVAPEYV